MDAHLGSLAVAGPVPFFLPVREDDGAASPRATEPAWEADGPAARISRRARAGLALLKEASDYARDLGRDPWHFAVPAKDLRRAGLTDNDLRWLAYKQFVHFAGEFGQSDGQGPPPVHREHLVFTKKTCFVLTDAGILFARRALEEAMAAGGLALHAREGNGDGTLPLPKWDALRRELRLGATLVKQFKVPADNQERILAAFEEEGWPARIDDPLPILNGDLINFEKCKRRLHDAINSLNRNQRYPLLRFLGDGRGEGVCWEFVRSG